MSPYLFHSLHESQYALRVALCDSFNTPAALDVLRELVSKANVYINSRGKNVNVGVVENVARWVGKILRIFGLGEGETSEIGWGKEGSKGGEAIDVRSHLVLSLSCKTERRAQHDEALMPYLRTLSTFRDGVRSLAIAKGDDALKEILALCDKLRDIDLVPLGVALDDQDGAFCSEIGSDSPSMD